MNPDYTPCGHTAAPTTLGQAADDYLRNVRRIAQKMPVKDLVNPSGRMTNLTVVRNILAEVAEKKMKRTVFVSRLIDSFARIQVRGADESWAAAEEFHVEYPNDSLASMKHAVEEFVGHPVERIGEAGGETLWLAAEQKQ